MRFVKATLSGLIVASLAMMWSTRSTVTDAYRTTPNTFEVRLSGVDLTVTQSEIGPSPFEVPAAPDTRRTPVPALSPPEPLLETPPVAMSGGDARLTGNVMGPDGPVADAVVGIERHTSDGVGSLRVATDAGGNWSAAGLPGGRYRVRAWLPGLMTMGRSEVAFLADEEPAAFDFSLWGVDPEPVLEFLHGGPIYQNLSATVAVVMSQRSVDLDGVVVTNPVAGSPVSIKVGRDVTLASSPIQFTDHQGAARFVLECRPSAAPDVPGASDPDVPGASTPAVPAASAADGTLIAAAGERIETFALPGCRPVPPAPPVPSAASPSGGAGPGGGVAAPSGQLEAQPGG